MRHCDLWGLKLELKLGMTLQDIIFFEILGGGKSEAESRWEEQEKMFILQNQKKVELQYPNGPSNIQIISRLHQ